MVMLPIPSREALLQITGYVIKQIRSAAKHCVTQASWLASQSGRLCYNERGSLAMLSNHKNRLLAALVFSYSGGNL